MSLTLHQFPRRILICPMCEYDLRGSIDADEVARCPECGGTFTLLELQMMYQAGDVQGQPRTLSPHERRIAGPAFIWIVLAVILLTVSAAAVLAIL